MSVRRPSARLGEPTRPVPTPRAGTFEPDEPDKPDTRGGPVNVASDRPRDACGVFGVYAPGEDVARLTYFGLLALQHRGQESAGIAVSDGGVVTVFRNLGLVSQVFNERVLAGLTGNLAIGHTRYSTTGSSARFDNAQPSHKTRAGGGDLALGHNGNLVNTVALAAMVAEAGEQLASSSDSDLIATLLARQETLDLVEAFRAVVPMLEGAYSLAVMDEERIYGIRDPHGFRPLSIGRLPSGGWVLASETCALDIVGAEFVREVDPGELVVIDGDGPRGYQLAEPKPRLCVFEFVYLARPDSTLYGRSVYEVRRAMGKQLADEAPAEADLVIPVPQAANASAQGFADRSAIPYAEGFVTNRYVGRTFIEPTPSLRAQGVRLKHNPLPEVIDGKRLVVVEDSIVRGTTTGEIVEMLRRSGAKEVHFRVASPPIRWPCFYGIDMSTRRELVAAERDVEQIREIIGADSLGYLSVDGMLISTGAPTERFCHACFTGGYPIPPPDDEQDLKHVLEGGPR